MSKTIRNNSRTQVRSKKDMKKSTKKLIKLEHKDLWNIPNKHYKKGDEYNDSS